MTADDLTRIDRALILLRRFVEAPGRVGDDGVELSTLLVLDAVAGAPEPATIGDIAAQLGVTHSTASRLTTRAEQAGMVRRAPSPSTRRVIVVTPTAAGAALHERAIAHRLARVQALTADWPAEDVAAFARLLDRFATRAHGEPGTYR